jgi:hypothetical protein
MPRRTLWLATGILTGAASSLYAERKLRRTLDAAAARLQPDALVTEVGRSARHAARTTGVRLRAAVATGRVEMQRREEELWADLSASGTPESSVSVTPVDDSTSHRPPGYAVSERADPPATTAVRTALAHASRARGRRRARGSPSKLGK